jgi:hypothetical protein
MGFALQTSKPVFPAKYLQIHPSASPPPDILPIKSGALTDQGPTGQVAHGFKGETAKLLHAMRVVTMGLYNFHHGVLEHTDIQSLVDKRSEIQEYLVSLPSANDPEDRAHRGDDIYEACRLAARIYWGCIYTTTPFSADTNGSHMVALKAALEKTNDELWWDAAPEVLVWTCLVGGAAARYRPERGWFIARLGPTMVTLGEKRPTELQGSLLTFGWLAGMCEARLKLF